MVVGGVPHRYPLRTNFSSDLSQERITDFTRGLFRRGMMLCPVGFNIARLYGNGDFQLFGQVGNVRSIGIGLGAAELMIEVSDMQFYAQFFTQFYQNVKQADRVGTAGYGYQKFLPGSYQVVSPDEVKNRGLRRCFVYFTTLPSKILRLKESSTCVPLISS